MADQLLTGTTLIEDKRVEFGKVWSCLGANFKSLSPDTDTVTYNSNNGKVTSDADGLFFIAPVSLPHGAIVTGAIVYGNAAAVAAESWYLTRVDLDDADTIFTDMAGSTAIGTEDTSINDETIDNNNYGYFLRTTSIDTNDAIWGARITYT